MLRSQRHAVRDAIDRALAELGGIEIELPLRVENNIVDAETLLRTAKLWMVE